MWINDLHCFFEAFGSKLHICPACKFVLVIVDGLAVANKHKLKRHTVVLRSNTTAVFRDCAARSLCKLLSFDRYDPSTSPEGDNTCLLKQTAKPSLLMG